MKHPHHTLAPWVLAWACGLGLTSAWAAPSAAALDALKQTETRMNALKALDEQARRAAQQASALGNASWYADNAWQQTRQSDADASAALQRASDCLPRLQLELSASAAAISALEQAISASHRAVQNVSSAPAKQLAQRTRAADASFEQRSSAEHHLTEQKQRLNTTAAECSSLVTATDAAVNRTVERMREFEQHAHALPAALERLRADMAAAISASQTAADAPWLSYRATPVALPPGTALQQLQQTLVGETAPTRSEATDTSALLALRQADADFERISTALARMQDAAAFLDLVAQPAALTCRGENCASYTAERRDLAVRISAARTELSTARTRLSTAAQGLNRLLAPVQAKARSNTQSIGRIAPAVAPALDETSRAGTLAQTAAEALEQAADQAYTEARTAWAAAYQVAYGTDPYALDQAPAAGLAGAMRGGGPALTMAPAPAPMAGLAAPSLRSQAYDVFAKWDAEPSGFGSYTYVLLRSRDDLKSAAVQRRFKVLLSVLHREQQAQTVPTEQRPEVNVFCIPGTRSNADGLDVSYDSDLGNQLKLRAKDAVFTLKAARNRLTTSPGPFLITLPGRIAQEKGDSPLLFADLSTYPDDAIADLVGSYMNGLLDNFPREKTLWKPPVLQRVALMMIHLATNVGELVTDTIPAAEARPQPR